MADLAAVLGRAPSRNESSTGLESVLSTGSLACDLAPGMAGSCVTGLGGTSDSEPACGPDRRNHPRIFLVLGNAPAASPGVGRLPRCGAACAPEEGELAASSGPASTERSIRHVENEARTRMSREQRMETHPARDRLALATFHPGRLPTASGDREPDSFQHFHRRRTGGNYLLKAGIYQPTAATPPI